MWFGQHVTVFPLSASCPPSAADRDANTAVVSVLLNIGLGVGFSIDVNGEGKLS